jgi:hypothetical protein
MDKNSATSDSAAWQVLQATLKRFACSSYAVASAQGIVNMARSGRG